MVNQIIIYWSWVTALAHRNALLSPPRHHPHPPASSTSISLSDVSILKGRMLASSFPLWVLSPAAHHPSPMSITLILRPDLSQQSSTPPAPRATAGTRTACFSEYSKDLGRHKIACVQQQQCLRDFCWGLFAHPLDWAGTNAYKSQAVSRDWALRLFLKITGKIWGKVLSIKVS